MRFVAGDNQLKNPLLLPCSWPACCLSPSPFHPHLLPNGVSMPVPLVSTSTQGLKNPLQLPPLVSTQGLKNTTAASTLSHSCFCHVPGLPVAKVLAGLETWRFPKVNPRLGKPACSLPFAAPPFATFLACLLPKFHPRLLPNGVSMPILLVSTWPLREGQRGA